MDRFTWGAVLGVVILCIVGIVTVLLPRQTQPPDLSAPDGVVTAYITAIRERRADDAWAFLDSPQALGSYPSPETPAGAELSQANFRQQVNNTARNPDRRIRIVQSTVTDDTARVDVELTSFSDGLFQPRSSSTTVTFNLKRAGSTWRITSSPPVWQLG